MQALFSAVSEPVTVHSPQVWVRFFEHVAEYDRLYRALLGRKGSPWFVLKMRSSLIDLVKKFGRLPLTDRPVYPAADEFVPNLIAAMLVEAVTWWLEQEKPYPAEEIARRCVALAGALFNETSTWQ